MRSIHIISLRHLRVLDFKTLEFRVYTSQRCHDLSDGHDQINCAKIWLLITNNYPLFLTSNRNVLKIIFSSIFLHFNYTMVKVIISKLFHPWDIILQMQGQGFAWLLQGKACQKGTICPLDMKLHLVDVISILKFNPYSHPMQRRLFLICCC